MFNQHTLSRIGRLFWVRSALFCVILSVAHAKEIHLDVTADAKQILVALPGNPTTGYQWFLGSYDKNILTLSNTQYIPSTTKRIGAGGVMQFVFSKSPTVSVGQTKLTFRHRRPWEKNQGTEQVVIVHFR